MGRGSVPAVAKRTAKKLLFATDAETRGTMERLTIHSRNPAQCRMAGRTVDGKTGSPVQIKIGRSLQLRPEVCQEDNPFTRIRPTVERRSEDSQKFRPLHPKVEEKAQRPLVAMGSNTRRPCHRLQLHPHGLHWTRRHCWRTIPTLYHQQIRILWQSHNSYKQTIESLPGS